MCIHICSTGLLFLEKTVVTLATLIWLLTSMYSLVYYKIMYHREPIVTGCILIWIFWSLCSLVFLSKQNTFHTGCIDKVYPHCVFSGVLLDILSKQHFWHTGCIVIFILFLHSMYSHMFYWTSFPGKNSCHTGYIDMAFHQYVFIGVL